MASAGLPETGHSDRKLGELALTDIRPPNPPWMELAADDDAGGYLSFYLADAVARVPVRGITLPANNKSDPNLETQTYGLFSICGHGMRASVVKRGCRYVLFVTRPARQPRVLVGFYRIRWYAPGSLRMGTPDYALAADDIRFIDPPISLDELPLRLRRVVGARFRVFKHIDRSAVKELVAMMRRRRDRTVDYLGEIERLERFNEYRTGYRYVNWKKTTRWTWDDARPYLRLRAAGKRRALDRRQATGFWECAECKETVFSKALLKRCPKCGAIDALSSVAPPPAIVDPSFQG